MLNRVHLEDIANASEADLSFFESFNDILKVQHTMGSDVYHDPYHISIIQTQLKRNLPTLCPDIEDEMVNAFNDYLPVRGNEWTAVPAYDTFRKIVARSTNRMLVGLPLCRDPGWVDFTVELSAAVAKEAAILRILPSFIVPF
ncbi:hypothetical protein ID866_8565 [Astraeus odoratus]|nr:hypothetical protein ID866_8565 [Astraeus odoratus]